MMSMNLSDIPILNIKGSDYRCIISGSGKSEAIIKCHGKYRFDRKVRNIKNLKKIFSYIKIGKEFLTFADIEIQKNKFYRHKSAIFLKDVYIEKYWYVTRLDFFW